MTENYLDYYTTAQSLVYSHVVVDLKPAPVSFLILYSMYKSKPHKHHTIKQA